jgi:uncharacterized membrane-anchored protein
MKKFRWVIILVNLIVLLGMFNRSIVRKEELLKKGELILLELAPVDPRSLMQGDYMRLNYAISDSNSDTLKSKRGFCVVKLDEFGIAQKVRVQKSRAPVSADEHLIEYSSGEWGRFNIGAESFFFQEGEAEKFENAKYGGLRVDRDGNSLLVGLYDENRIKIE